MPATFDPNLIPLKILFSASDDRTLKVSHCISSVQVLAYNTPINKVLSIIINYFFLNMLISHFIIGRQLIYKHHVIVHRANIPCDFPCSVAVEARLSRLILQTLHKLKVKH